MAKRLQRTNPNGFSGFTLLEMLVVVAIILVLTAMSVAALSMFGQGSAAKHAARILQSQFYRARQMAASTRVYHFLYIDAVANRMTIFKDNLTAAGAVPRVYDVLTDTLVGDSVELPKGVAFRQLPPGGAAPVGQGIPPALVIAFRPDGSITSYAFPFGAPPPPLRPDNPGPTTGTDLNLWPTAGIAVDLVLAQTDNQGGCIVDWSYPAGKVIKITYSRTIRFP